jgi:hypothetical protein
VGAQRILAASQEEHVFRQTLALSLAASLSFSPCALAQPVTADADGLRGIRQVEDGDYDPAIVTLDAAARRLTGDPARARDLSQAYLYLGIAYIGKGHEAAAKAKFREAVSQIKDLTLSPDKFPPKVIDLFEAARAEARAEATPAPAAAATPTPAAAARRAGAAILIVGGLAAVGGGVALAREEAGRRQHGRRRGRTHDDHVAAPPAAPDLQRLAGRPGQRGFTVTATRAGTLDAMLTWQDVHPAQHRLPARARPTRPAAPRTGRRPTAGLSTNVIQTTYLIVVANYSGRAGTEAFTLMVLYP